MRHRAWHKVWADKLLSDPDYLALSPAARGILADLRCFAARTADHGRTGHTEKSLVQWYGNRESASTGVKSLRYRRLIGVEPRTKILRIPNWDESQETTKAAMMRRLRAQRTQEDDGNNAVTVTGTVTGEGEGEGDTPLSPLPEIPAEIEQLAFRIFGHAPLANLSEWLGLHGAATVRAALLETEKNGKRAPAYTAAILQSWARNGGPKGNGGNGHGTPEKVELYDPARSLED